MSKMKALYLHGYQGEPRQEMIDYLESKGFDVIAPHLDYDNEPDVFIKLLEEDYDVIVGNSLGGYIGYYLSEWKSVPSILINPPMYMDLKLRVNIPSTDVIQKYQESKPSINNKKHFVIGMDDVVVNPFKVIEWLFENKPNSDLHAVDGMGHNYSYKQLFDSIGHLLSKWSD